MDLVACWLQRRIMPVGSTFNEFYNNKYAHWYFIILRKYVKHEGTHNIALGASYL